MSLILWFHSQAVSSVTMVCAWGGGGIASDLDSLGVCVAYGIWGKSTWVPYTSSGFTSWGVPGVAGVCLELGWSMLLV